MDADNTDYKHSALTEQIIGAAFEVHRELGFGFLEKVYENALALQLRKLGLTVAQQSPVAVYFDSSVVGAYVADLIIEDQVIVELKSVDRLMPAHEAQLVNYLKAIDIEVGLLMNFGRKVEVKRKVFSKSYQRHLRSSASNK
ncbi:MAG TPA: GxxExxY protein [Mariprofundaceae bacterium]|nr:GxxExxY protein [Mariprofundaceae bacterium]